MDEIRIGADPQACHGRKQRFLKYLLGKSALLIVSSGVFAAARSHRAGDVSLFQSPGQNAPDILLPKFYPENVSIAPTWLQKHTRDTPLTPHRPTFWEFRHFTMTAQPVW